MSKSRVDGFWKPPAEVARSLRDGDEKRKRSRNSKKRKRRSKSARRASQIAVVVTKIRRALDLKPNQLSAKELVAVQKNYEQSTGEQKLSHDRVDVLLRFCERLGISAPLSDWKPSKSKSHIFTKWREVRYQALLRSKGRCECCGATAESSGQPLHVDHIKPKSRYPDLEFELDNLQVLCADCNIGKSNVDETDWR